jgi:uncharacterized protein YcbX
MKARVASLTIFPVKSLDGVTSPQATVGTRGGLLNDRRWAIVDASGELVNAKRTPRMHVVHAHFQLEPVRVSFPDRTEVFDLHRNAGSVAQELSLRLGMEVGLVENPDGGFPDDPQASGPTIVSTATIEEVARWFGILPEECRRRFRSNIEIDGVPPFAEDQLYGPGGPRSFSIGSVRFQGQNPCQRCVVPTRDSTTGAVTDAFAKIFRERREGSLPDWAPRKMFNHYYRLAVNTTVQEEDWGRSIAVGDPLILE